MSRSRVPFARILVPVCLLLACVCGKDKPTAPASQGVLPTPPPAPTALTATATSTSRIDLTWTDNAGNETGFHVERAPGGTTNFTQIASLAANATSYSSTGLSAGTSYAYRVHAYNGVGESGNSNTATASTQAQPTIPAAPTALAASGFQNSGMYLTWTDNATDEAGFEVERAPGGTTSFTRVASLGANTTTYMDRGLLESTSYTYRVRAFNDAGASAYSNTSTGTTLGPPPGLPAAPAALAATAVSSSQINLSWTDRASNETGFYVERAPGGTTSFTQIATLAANSTSYASTGLNAGTSYSYRVRAYNGTGPSASSNVATATTLVATGPPAPTGLAATASSMSQINLAWTDNASNESGYYVEQAPGGTASFAQVASLAANATSCSITGLTAGTSYSFRVRAYNGAGTSAYSNTATATTWSPPPVNPPAAPSGLTATAVSMSQINLGWTDNAGNESGFYVERAPGGTASFTQIASLAANTTTYSSTGLSAATSYSYRVRAYNGMGTSGYSNTATATTATGTRRLRIINNATDAFLNQVVQVKIVASGGTFTTADLLATDGRCWDLPQSSISIGQSLTFDVSASDYKVFIGMGRWECDMTGLVCTTNYCWWKRTYTTDVNWNNYWVWVAVNVTGHASGTADWTVSGLYTVPSLRVTPAGQSPINFNVTSTNPIAGAQPSSIMAPSSGSGSSIPSALPTVRWTGEGR